jgi:hypothetical protein
VNEAFNNFGGYGRQLGGTDFLIVSIGKRFQLHKVCWNDVANRVWTNRTTAYDCSRLGVL